MAIAIDSTRATSIATASLAAGLGKRATFVEVRQLAHYFGNGETRKQVLFDNRLDVHRGEIVIMTGPSGSGKTTLLTLVGTLRSVQEGSVRVLGTQLKDATKDDINKVRRKLGFIFQAHNLFESLTAFQNVRMAAELVGLGRAEANDRITDLLDRLGLKARMHYRPDSLSGGQKQRVAIARALVHRPQLILADEPTAALDEASGREVVTLFQELAHQEGCTVIMVTHDNRILDVADRIVNMVDGRIKSDVFVHEAAVICDFLKSCPLFVDLTPQSLADVADMMLVEEAQEKDIVVRQGDAGDRFYLIRTGSVDVVVEKQGKKQVVAKLDEGDYFGETALMTDAPRNATVVATSGCVFYTLDKESFQSVLKRSPTFEEQLRNALFQRQ